MKEKTSNYLLKFLKSIFLFPQISLLCTQSAHCIYDTKHMVQPNNNVSQKKPALLK